MPVLVFQHVEGHEEVLDLRDRRKIRLRCKKATGFKVITSNRAITRRDGILSLVRCGSPRHRYVLIGGSETFVNGLPLVEGMHILRDYDEVSQYGCRALFLSRSNARLSRFPGEKQVTCPVCGDPIQEGSLAVECPGCSVWYHMSDQMPCWSYLGECDTPGCGQKTEVPESSEYIVEKKEA